MRLWDRRMPQGEVGSVVVTESNDVEAASRVADFVEWMLQKTTGVNYTWSENLERECTKLQLSSGSAANVVGALFGL